MSSAVVTDQKPASSGYSVTRSVQWTGHSPRICLNTSCGGPSTHSSRSADEHVLEIAGNRRHLDLPVVVADRAAIILAGRPGMARRSSAQLGRRRRRRRSRSSTAAARTAFDGSSPTLRRATSRSPTFSRPIAARRSPAARSPARPIASAPSATAPPASAPRRQRADASAPSAGRRRTAAAVDRARGAQTASSLAAARRMRRGVRVSAAPANGACARGGLAIVSMSCSPGYTALCALAPAARSAAANGAFSDGSAMSSEDAAVEECVQADAREHRAVGAQLVGQAVEEAEPALDDGEALRVAERDVHRAVAAHRVAGDRARAARRRRSAASGRPVPALRAT